MTNPKRIALTALGVAVAGGLLALLVLARGTNSDEPRAAAPAADAPTAPTPEPSAGAPTARVRPRVEAAEEPDEADAGPRVYMRDDGKIVRDHRSGNPEPMMTGGVPVPNKLRKVEPGVIYSMRTTMRPLVYQCAEAIADDALGDDPMIQGEVMISIADGAVTVDQVAVKFRDVDAETEGVADCVRNAVADVGFAAEGHADVSRYWLTMPFKLRRSP